MNDFINKEYLYAVIGATSNPDSSGYKVLNALKDKGYRVIGVSPYSDEINGIRCFESIIDFDDRPDVIVVATPPIESLTLVEDCLDFGLDKFWFQPNCCSLDFFQNLESQGVDVVCDRDLREDL